MRTGPVVVCVLSHREPHLIRRLVGRLLEGEHTHVLLHHDPRSEPHGVETSDRVLPLPNPRPCDWGRMNFPYAMVRCVREALAWQPDLSWVLLISGQDYPTRQMGEIETELHQATADAMVRYFRVDLHPVSGEHPWQTRCRQRYLHRLRLPGQRRSIPFPRRHPFGYGTALYIGDTWVNLGHRAAQHLVRQSEVLPRVDAYLARCANPDEAYLPTLLLNDAQGLDIVDDRRRFIEWTEGQPHPRVLGEADLANVVASEAFFARKVNLPESARLLDALDDISRAAGRST